MRSVIQFEKILEEFSSSEHFVYSKADLRNLLPAISDSNLNMILSRCVSHVIFDRVCKGIYSFNKAKAEKSRVLYKTATKLRAGCMNYISLETVLCENSIISQQMPSYLTVMTTGRSGTINCGNFGTIEFVHTAKDFTKISENLFIDSKAKMLKANPIQAYTDIVDAKRTTLDLINKTEMKELFYE